MDSLTHIVLGAAIGEVMLGKKIGRKAALIGAFAKTFPDFDLFYTGLKDPFLYVCHHRGHTHSLFWELLYAFPLAFVFFKLFKDKVKYWEWFALMIVCLWGHSLIDTCTNYGTRLLLPFTNQSFSTYSLSIVDLFLTLPMLILLAIGIWFRDADRRKFYAKSLLIYCFIYIGYSYINKLNANSIFKASLAQNNISHTDYVTNPTILNNFLWYGLARNDSMIYIAENSLLFPKANPKWLSYRRNHQLLEQCPDRVKAETLKWFSCGYDINEKVGDTLNTFCVKFGRTNMQKEDLYSTFIFHYKLYDGKMTMIEPNDKNANMKEGFIDLYHRIMGHY